MLIFLQVNGETSYFQCLWIRPILIGRESLVKKPHHFAVDQSAAVPFPNANRVQRIRKDAMRVVNRKIKSKIVAQTFQIKERIIQLLHSLWTILQKPEISLTNMWCCTFHDMIECPPILFPKEFLFFCVRKITESIPPLQFVLIDGNLGV